MCFFFFFSVWICKCFVVPSHCVVKRLFNTKNSYTKYKQRRCNGKHLNNLAIFKELSFNRLIQKLDHFPFTNSQQSLIRSLFIHSSCDLKTLWNWFHCCPACLQLRVIMIYIYIHIYITLNDARMSFNNHALLFIIQMQMSLNVHQIM